MRIYALQGDTLDALCWRHYGRTQDVLEQVYDANPGLSELGAILPHGYPVELPDMAPAAQRETIQLWD
ncbi:tail protein X [Yersinia enterocolitica]|uniref:Phage-related tail protein n=1 Tax=Yersinia enterocolitica TaxID=630 RepID=A0A0H5HBG4_YEREN|nr:tail protein X [Yersinia enterocolitica]EKN3331644.1 tail protein X [Yersinia enterocolitica]EKN3413221.1 tail protein X [Yersinia enterocolitica]EKN3496993.1 tail protein X [Yersinia enterocolitica]EKN3510272.1 tail protein X [Yersinia enterocolitica]EKN3557932.1 tail protein X [Yersinia enterocolitica]